MSSRSFISKFIIVILLSAFFLTGCQTNADALIDGFYTSEAATFDTYGWKEYITIQVSGGIIVSVEYNAKNASGFIKSWDMSYMRLMNETDGTYPNEYTRRYSHALLLTQSPTDVDAIAGATTSHITFQLLAQAAISQARKGDKNVIFVDCSEVNHHE